MMKRPSTFIFAVALASAAPFALAGGANARTETVLYEFCSQTGCADGYFPSALIQDSAGSFFGTTQYGGPHSNHGVVFKIAKKGTETVLHSFGDVSGDGRYPTSLIEDKAGNLYGTTQNGGTGDCGVIFKVKPNGDEAVLHRFTGPDGCIPVGLIGDSAGNFYGVTQTGGNKGLVFELASDGTETVLHEFTGGDDGAYPIAGVIRDSAGNLFGTTSEGGTNNYCYSAGCGIVYKIAPDGTETVLHVFTGGDGQEPVALVQDAAGNLYGTAIVGGTYGYGAIFEITAGGSESTLHAFTNGVDGANPYDGLILSNRGILDGTTEHGGANGGGTAFRLNLGGRFLATYQFCSQSNCEDGSWGARLIRPGSGSKAGVRFGTTLYGGISTNVCHTGCGVIFKLTK